jgi:hypothetical protein
VIYVKANFTAVLMKAYVHGRKGEGAQTSVSFLPEFLEKDTFCKENEREREKKVYQILI